jgi:carbon-monoxide dehydrogenase medium subunit
MRPLPLGYFRPASIEEALEILETYGDEAKVLAGGQSLVPMLNLRLARPAYLVDLNGVRELSYLRLDGGWLRIGAMTRHVDIERSDVVKRTCPALAEAVRYVGHPHIRFRGTFGGSIAHADPAAEFPAVVAALGGQIVLRGSRGSRSVPAEEFFIGYLTTALERSEIVVEVRLPSQSEAVAAVEELAPRHGDFAVAGSVVQVRLNHEGIVETAAIGLLGVGPVPCAAREAEQVLVGRPLTAALANQAAKLAAGACDPEDDIHASAEYRRKMAEVLTTRALLRCAGKEAYR